MKTEKGVSGTFVASTSVYFDNTDPFLLLSFRLALSSLSFSLIFCFLTFTSASYQEWKHSCCTSATRPGMVCQLLCTTLHPSELYENPVVVIRESRMSKRCAGLHRDISFARHLLATLHVFSNPAAHASTGCMMSVW